MKTLGIIGGLSWYSTIVYYRTINQLTNLRLGESHSAKILLYSVDFNEFRILQEKDDWIQIEFMLRDIAIRLQKGGADFIIMATNTPHLVADKVRKSISIPLLHIAEETGKAIARQNISRVGLLGTRFTMEHNFFKDKLSELGIEPIIPNEGDRIFIHSSVFNELTKGKFEAETKAKYFEIMNKLQERGAQGIIFGCTEMTLLINQSEYRLPIFETATIHSNAAVEFALG